MIKAKLACSDIKIADVLILVVLISLNVFLFKQYWFNTSDAIEFIAIQVSNQAPQLYPAIAYQRITVDGVNGESVIEIKSGKARFLHSHCLTQQCVLHGWISKAGQSIVCLPNQISLTLVGRNSEFDALNF